MLILRKELDGTVLDIGGGGEGIIGRLYADQVTAIDNRQEELDEAPGACRKLLMDATGIMCTLADDADSCVAYGCGKSLAWINHMQEGPINIAKKRIMRG